MNWNTDKIVSAWRVLYPSSTPKPKHALAAEHASVSGSSRSGDIPGDAEATSDDEELASFAAEEDDPE
eukprot:11272873-Alexandrium_andersonii.AAC.1